MYHHNELLKRTHTPHDGPSSSSGGVDSGDDAAPTPVSNKRGQASNEDVETRIVESALKRVRSL